MKEGWEYKKLEELCSVITKGTTPTTVGYNFSESGISFVKIESIGTDGRIIPEKLAYITNECHNALSRSKLENHDLLFSIAGALGKVAIVQEEILPANTNQALAIIRLLENNEVFLSYLKRFLQSSTTLRRISELKVGVAQQNLSLSQIKNLNIPIPSIEQQQSIVSELDLINELIAKKKAQLKDLDSLARSLFYEMFGDPVENEKGWEVKKLCEICSSKLKYGSGASAVEFNGSIRYVRITDINEDGTLNDDIKSPSSIEDDYLLNVGDIVFARSGATVGKTYLHKNDSIKCIYAGYLIKATVKSEIVQPNYVFHFTKSKAYKDWVELTARAVAQPNINAKQYGDLSIPLPPLPLQQTFASRIEAIEEEKQKIQSSLKDLETLLASRMQYWFEKTG